MKQFTPKRLPLSVKWVGFVGIIWTVCGIIAIVSGLGFAGERPASSIMAFGTLFAFVADPTKDEPDDILMWAGTGSRNDVITSVQVIRDKLKPYAELPDDIAQRLQTDMGDSTGPTPLQRYINALMHDIEQAEAMKRPETDA